MKKGFLSFLFVSLVLTLSAPSPVYTEGTYEQPGSSAPSFDLGAPLPVDPNVITGTLDNGLKYYIRENAKPADRAVLRLVVNAGSVLEDADQRGLAHFTEHMAFNGTKIFRNRKSSTTSRRSECSSVPR